MSVTAARVTVVDHPLVQHKLGLLRDEETPTQFFRQLVNEVAVLLTYEVTKDMPVEEVGVATPLERMTVPRISGKKVAVVPILRAGIGMLDGVLSLVTAARVGFIGLYRDEDTLAAGRVLRQAARRRRRARRHPPRPDAGDRKLDGRRSRHPQEGRRSVGADDCDHRRARRAWSAFTARTPTSTSWSPRSIEGSTSAATSSRGSATQATASTARSDRRDGGSRPPGVRPGIRVARRPGRAAGAAGRRRGSCAGLRRPAARGRCRRGRGARGARWRPRRRRRPRLGRASSTSSRAVSRRPRLAPTGSRPRSIRTRSAGSARRSARGSRPSRSAG